MRKKTVEKPTIDYCLIIKKKCYSTTCREPRFGWAYFSLMRSCNSILVKNNKIIFTNKGEKIENSIYFNSLTTLFLRYNYVQNSTNIFP